MRATRKISIVFTACLLTTSLGGTTMAEEPKSAELVAAENAQKIAEAEQAAAEAKLAAAKAARQLSDVEATEKAALDTAVANAEAAILAKEKAASDAKSALIATEQAQLKAKFGSVSTNSVTDPTVTAGTGAGTAEATLLAAEALREAAGSIGRDLGQPEVEATKLVILTGVDRPTFANWRLFEVKRKIIETNFQNSSELSKKADAAFASLTKQAPADDKNSGGVEAFGTVVTGAGAILDSVAKLGSFFKTSYDFANLTVSSDNELLATAVAAEVVTTADSKWAVHMPGRWMSQSVEDDVVDLLETASKARLTSAGQLAIAQANLETLSELAKNVGNDAERKRKIAGVVDIYQRAVAAHQTAQKSFDDFFSSLGSPDSNNIALISKIMDEKYTSDLVSDGANILIVNVHAAGGSSYTKKNLWTFFGRLPFSVAGGVVVSYVLFNSEGQLIKANQFQRHAGYQSVNRVQQTLKAAEDRRSK